MTCLDQIEMRIEFLYFKDKNLICEGNFRINLINDFLIDSSLKIKQL